MTAPRCPPGWSQEAADFIWLDWTMALDGIGGGAAGLTPADKKAPPMIPGARWVSDHDLYGAEDSSVFSDEYRNLIWDSREAHMRAWAAVGAPVLAPSENGRPSLAEWVAACEAEGMLYKPARGHDAHVCFMSSADGRLPYACVHIHSADVVFLDTDAAEGIVCSSPAELRASLDRLGEAKHA